jgi:peptidyl-prolyl cis-trans isomerase SurA
MAQSVILLHALSCSVLQKPVTGDAVLFSVDGDPVTVEEFKYVYEKNNYDNDELYTEEDVRAYLDMFIRFKLKVREAENLGYDTVAAFIEEYEMYRKQLATPLLTEAKFQEQLIEEAYERLKHEVRASHILIRIPKNAAAEDTLRAFNRIAEIREEAVAGADFNRLAREYSEDPSARSNGGDLGYFSAFQMVYPFESAAFTTEVGDISSIIRSSFGYHIVYVTDKRPSPGKVKVAHILLRVKPDKSDSVAVAERAFELYDQLAGGGDWDILCARYSEDTRTRQNGGSLPYLTHGQIDPEFMDMAFSITEPGGISDPFMTRYGWHILKLEDRLKVGTLEEMRDEIESKVRRDERAVASKSRMLDQLSTKLALRVDQTALQYVMSRADSSLLDGKWRFDARQASLQDTLFYTAQSSYTMYEFLEFVQQNQRTRKNIAPADYMYDLYEEYMYQCLLEDEIKALSARDPDFRYLLNEYYEGILLFNIMEDQVWSRATADSAALLEYFEQNRDRFTWGERARATVYKSNTQEVVDSIARHFAAKDTIVLQTIYLNGAEDTAMVRQWQDTMDDAGPLLYLVSASQEPELMPRIKRVLNEADVADAQILPTNISPAHGVACITAAATTKKSLEWIFNRESTLTLEVREGLFEKGDGEIPKGVSWSVGTHRLSNAGSYYLVSIEDIEAPAPKALHEVKGSVISAYQDHLEQKWLKVLEEKYPVEVNNKILKRLF